MAAPKPNPVKKPVTGEKLPQPKPGRIRVRARITDGDNRVVGYYGVARIREGQTFTIRTMQEFSNKWMELVDGEGNPVDDKGKPLPVAPVSVDVDTGGGAADDDDNVI